MFVLTQKRVNLFQTHEKGGYIWGGGVIVSHHIPQRRSGSEFLFAAIRKGVEVRFIQLTD